MRNIFGSRFTQGVLLVLAFFAFLSAYNRYLIALDMADRRKAVEAEVESLHERKENLESEVRYLSNERGMESEMRKQFDIAREGEQVVIIMENEDSSKEVIQATTSATSTRAWYHFW